MLKMSKIMSINRAYIKNYLYLIKNIKNHADIKSPTFKPQVLHILAAALFSTCAHAQQEPLCI